MTMNDKKSEKKRKKFVARLKDSKGIIYTEVPSCNIVICNAGQATGLQKEIIHELITQSVPDLPLPSYVAEKGESHSYLAFNSIESSRIFYDNCNGKIIVDKDGPPMYMLYVENVPNMEVMCQEEKPEGLHLLQNIITVEEEKKFLQIFDCFETSDMNNLKNRQVKHYGYEFRYGSNDVDLNNPLPEKIPQECGILWSRLKESGIDVGKKPDQLTVNKYLPGQGIPSHVDKHSPFGDKILSLSLGGDVVMDWRHRSGKYAPVVLEGRSMMVMTGEARYDWQHGIQPRTYDPIIEIRTTNNQTHKVITNDTTPRLTRVSLTFRWTRSGECQCGFNTLCDSVEKSTEDLEDGLASNLEELHVHQVYEQIAGHFSTTRHKPWPRVVEFMSRVQPGAVVCDLGCGNGKNILRRNDVVQIAGERSSGLLSECKSHIKDIAAADCVRLDLLNTTLKDECADVVICIAVIHHFSSKMRRLQSIATISRLLRPGGRALVTVWAKDQTKSNYLLKSRLNDTATNEVKQTVGGLSLPVHENRTQFQHNDLLVPWKLRNVKENKLDQPESTLLRFYHVFEETELEQLFKQIPDFIVENSFYEEGNWCVICRKI